jgi:molecular chaperone GrpE
MGDTREKGAFQADIPSDAIEEALRSVERVKRGAEQDAEGVPVEVPDAQAPADGALPAELESLRTQLELSMEKGRETLEKLKDEHDRRLRAAADLENYKKRAQREREEVQKYGVEKLAKDLLPVMDNLDRALSAAPPDHPLAEGVRLVRASLEQALTRHGVKGYSALGRPFDPALHEALLQVPSEEAPGTVVLEHARGFLIHDRLLRPAMVGVAVAPKGAAGDGAPTAGVGEPGHGDGGGGGGDSGAP